MMRIEPVKKTVGRLSLPADKSVFQRAVLLAGNVEGKSAVSFEGEISGDVLSAISSVSALGARTEIKKGKIEIFGTDKIKENQTLNCGNSATCMRLLTGILCGKNVSATLTGDASLLSRPMARVETPLCLLGGNVQTENGFAPVKITPSDFQGGSVCADVLSAQVKSAVLLSGAFGGDVSYFERLATRDHTERLLSLCGGFVKEETNGNGHTVWVKKGGLRPFETAIPADFSSAAYFLSLGALKGELTLLDVGVNPTRTAFLDALDRAGVRVLVENEEIVGNEPRADLTVFSSKILPIFVSEDESARMIDEIPVLSVLLSFASSVSEIRGLKELKNKESDRLHGIKQMLSSLGGKAEISGDTLFIYGQGENGLKGGRFSSNDHRLTMSAVVGLLLSKNGGEIENEQSVNVSFPQFFEKIKECGRW